MRRGFKVFVIAVAVTACGGSGADTESEQTAEPSPSSTASSPTTVPTTTTTVAPTTTVTEAVGPMQLEDLEGVNPAGDFWLVPPGSYTFSKLPVDVGLDVSERLSFSTLGTSLLIIGESPFDIHGIKPSMSIFALEGFADPATSTQFNSTDPIAVPFGDDEEIADFLAGTQPFELIQSGIESVAGGDAAWWEFTVDTDATGGFQCAFSDNCFNVFVHPEHGHVVAAPEWVFRVWRFGDGDSELWAFLQAEDRTYESGLVLADRILSGLSLVDS